MTTKDDIIIENTLNAMESLDKRMDNIWNFLVFKFPELKEKEE